MSQTGQNSAVRTREAFSGYLFCNPDTGIEWNSQHPIDSGECEDATDIHRATFPRLISYLQEAWQALAESEAQRIRDITEAEDRGAEEQRRKDAEGQRPVAWQVRDMRGGAWTWKKCSERAHEEYKKHSTIETRELFCRPANVAALEARVKELEAEAAGARTTLGACDKRIVELRDAISGISQYCEDTLDCPVDGDVNMAWHREGIEEIQKRARAALTREGGV